MYIWSWTFLIIPAAVIVAGIGAFFAIKAIARRIKRKAAAKQAAKQAQQQEKQQEKTLEQTTEKDIVPTHTAEALLEKQQQAPVAEVQKQTTDVTAPQAKLSDAEYIKQIVALPFDAKDNEIVMHDKQKHTEWLIATKKLNDPESSDDVRAQAENDLKILNQYFEEKYHQIPTMPSPANYVASVNDKNGKTILDFRNYCYDGNGAPNFKAECEKSYTAQGRDEMPTIFQVDSESHPSLVVSSTQAEMFDAGIEDIKAAMTAQKIENCTFHLITDENGRKLITQQGTIKDIDKFIEENIGVQVQEEDFTK